MQAIDLFAGWGGFSLGAQQAGLDVVWASNHWPLAVATHKLNHPHTTHECQDLRQADWTRLPEFDVLLASPACQGHSTASQPRRRPYHDALRATAMAVIDCADICEPRAVVVENVPAFRHWRLYRWWCDGLRALGYQLDVRELTASRFGVPQRRRRLFIIATRPGIHVGTLSESPTETPIGPYLLTVGNEQWKPFAEATASVQARIARGRARHGNRFITQHTTAHAGVPLDQPLRTITTAPAHWNLFEATSRRDPGRYRALTGRELARAMGFPDEFIWPDTATVSEVTKGLGNAVCPPVAATLLRQVADAVA
jgi:DNA (cytosine-5)-methyltransferase 1